MESAALIVVETEAAGIGLLAPLADATRQYIRASKAENTRRAYRADWDHFLAWCAEYGALALPAAPDTLALYLTDLSATHKPGTLQRRVSAISQAHQKAGHDSPAKAAVVRAVLAGIRRTKGTAQEGKTAAVTDDIRAMLAHLPSGLLGIRDRALLLVGFAGAFRRSELVGLDREHVEITRDGLGIVITRCKTDQEGQGRKIGIPYGSNPQTCPVRALEDWLAASGITGGPIYRSVNRHGQLQAERLSDKAVALVVKRYAAAAGLEARKYAGHSLRAGLATAAAMGGASERSIMQQTGHRSTATVRRYIRNGSLFAENAAARVGL